MVFCLLPSLTESIQRHNLIKGEGELQSCRRNEVILLIKVKGIIVMLLILLLKECFGITHVRCPNVFACSNSIEYLGKVRRTDSLKCIHRLEIIPIKFRELIKSLYDLWRFLLLVQFCDDSVCNRGDLLSIRLLECFIGISYGCKDHPIHIMHRLKLIERHITERSVANNLNDLFDAA